MNANNGHMFKMWYEHQIKCYLQINPPLTPCTSLSKLSITQHNKYLDISITNVSYTQHESIDDQKQFLIDMLSDIDDDVNSPALRDSTGMLMITIDQKLDKVVVYDESGNTRTISETEAFSCESGAIMPKF